MKSDAYRYGIWLIAAVGFHLALLFGPWGFLRQEAAYHVSEVEGIEVSIVDSAPGAPAEAPPAPAAPPQVAVVPPEPVPPPPAPATPPPVPEPEPVKPAENPEPREELEKSEPKPRVERPPKTTAAKSTSSTASPHSAAPSGAQQTTATGTTTGASASKSAGISGAAGNSSPGYLSNPHPPYPPESKARREQGIVMLAVSINESGAVTSISVSQSSGFPRLDQAAREGVNHWRFRPARVAGFPVSSHLAVPVRFRLSD